MFRLSHYMRQLVEPTPVRTRKGSAKPVVIWNLTRRCNLRCRHCYTTSADVDFPGELTHEQAMATLEDLGTFGIPALILSGGEPLARRDLFDIASRAREMGMFLALSTNGTQIIGETADRVAEIGFDYVGISLDGIGATHDAFRRKEGAFAASMNGIRLCHAHGIKVGIRFTLTRDNQGDLPGLLALMEREAIDKFYLSHLNYAGRGNKNRAGDAHFRTTRAAMDLLFDTAFEHARNETGKEFVTGNNDADGVYLLHWAAERFPEAADHLRAKLVQWGGNSSGVNVANIDNVGDVHPDTFWWHYRLGNIRERPFSEIWPDVSDPIMKGLKARPRAIKGRCGACAHFDICGGNTRIRALQLAGNAWDEDPGCYLSDAEIGVATVDQRRAVRPYSRRDDHARAV